MVFQLTDRLLRDRSGATKATYALLGAIVVFAGIGAIGGAGAKLGERVATSEPLPEPAALAEIIEPVAPVAEPPQIVGAASAPPEAQATPVAVLASVAPHVGSEAPFAPARTDRPSPVTAARAEQARLDAIRDAVSIALATAAIERASADAGPADAAWIPASGTLDIRPRSRPSED